MSNGPVLPGKGTIYESMKFPPYKYQEYPKYIELKVPDAEGNKFKIVNNHREELEVVEQIVPVATLDKVRLEKEDLERRLKAANAQLDSLASQDLTQGGPATADILPTKNSVQLAKK